MQVPFNDLKRQSIELESSIREVMTRVLRSGWYVMGSEHDAFEREFADYCQSSFAVGVANGTDALELALRCAGVGKGDEVVTVANAGGYTTAACLALGAVPVYVDVDADTLQMSPDWLPKATGQKTKAVVATHLYGKRCDLAALRHALSDRDVTLVEDCAQAHGVQPLSSGDESRGDLATFSFYPTKNLGAIGDGGAIVTNNDHYARTLKRLRQYGWTNKYTVEVAGGRNSRLDELHAAVLRLKLPYLDQWNEQRRDIVRHYRQASTGTALQIVHEPAADFVGHLCVARHPQRDVLRERFRERGIETAIHYPILDHQQPALKTVDWRATPLVESQRALKEILSLPCFPELCAEEVEYVCDCIKTLA